MQLHSEVVNLQKLVTIFFLQKIKVNPPAKLNTRYICMILSSAEVSMGNWNFEQNTSGTGRNNWYS